MKKLGIVAFVLAAVVLLTPSLAQKSTPPDEKTKVCHQCEWLAIQISDIDEKIASWQRQTASINKYSNLADPNIQGALKDIANRISALNAKKAKLEAELAECKKRCAALSAPPAPMTPPTSGGTHTGGGGAGGGTPGGTTTGGTTGTTPTTPPVGEPCPPKGASGSKTTGPGAGIYVPPPVFPLPPLPMNLYDRDEWRHLLWHMKLVDSGMGDALDLSDVIWDIEDLIGDAYDDLAADPKNGRARARLRWLYKQLDFYQLWQAVEDRYYRSLFGGKPDCPLPKIYIGPLFKKATGTPTEDSPFYNPSGSYTPYGNGTPNKSGGGGAYPYQPSEPDEPKPNGQNAPDNVPGPRNIPHGTNGGPP